MPAHAPGLIVFRGTSFPPLPQKNPVFVFAAVLSGAWREITKMPQCITKARNLDFSVRGSVPENGTFLPVFKAEAEPVLENHVKSGGVRVG
jgi:hypothetical protein